MSGALPSREALVARYRAGRERSREIFAMVAPEAYYERPIALRNPIVFYEGHLPAFGVNTLVKLALGQRGIDEELERLFARGIDPEDEAGIADPGSLWPSRDEVLAYASAADALVEETLRNADIDDASRPCLRDGEAVFTILEHEVMHQETLLYMLHNLPHGSKRRPAGMARVSRARTSVSPEEMIEIPAGTATLGMKRGTAFGWDNEFGEVRVAVGAFSVARCNVTNGEFAGFVDAGGYTRRDLWSPEAWRWIESSGVRHPHFWVERDGRRLWRGMFEFEPLDASWPVYVTYAEAEAFAKWRGARLMSEPEFHRAAYGTPEGGERLHPWGNAAPSESRGNFGFASFDPVPVGSTPGGASAWGVEDLVGNGWEWTSSLFAPLPGFTPMPSYPQYSADFFDDAHFVMKGASPVTGSELIRRSFRNWFRPAYPYVYATFRIAR